LVEGLGLDEAFLDVAGLRRHYESPVQIGLAIRERVKGQVGLPASVGIASSKFLAKLASQAAKPDGLRHIPSSVQLEFLHALSVEALWGVGPATLAGLHRLGVVTIGDLAAVPESTLKSTMGPGQGAHLSRLANAIDDRPVEPHSNAKSISVEETYQKDLVGRDLIESALMAHAQRLSMRLSRAGLAGRTVTLKLRFSDFTTVTRSRTYATGTSDQRELYTASLMLLDQIPSRQPVRLLGLGGSSFEDHSAPRQDSLDSDDAWQRIARAVADVEDKYGAGSVAPARTLHLTADDEDDPPTDL
jgi:DNA polymerase-4